MTHNFPYRICYVEDGPLVAKPVKLGFEVLLDAEVDLFTTTNQALDAMQKEGFDKWGIFILDNRTGHGMMSGLELAQEIKKEHPKALVVSLNSSDIAELRDLGLEELRKQGIEFWYKREESFLMIPWVADCVKERRMIPKLDWLNSIGEEAFDYTEMDWRESRKTEKVLRLMCLGFRDSIDKTLKGILMERNVKEWLDEIRNPSRGIEHE